MRKAVRMADAVKAVLRDTAEALTSRVRSHARQAGWPEHISESLVMQEKDGDLRIGWPEHMTDKVMALEFGDQNQSPRPAIHTFYTQHQKSVRVTAVSKMTPIVREINRVLA